MISTLQSSAPFEYRVYSRYSFPRSPHAIESIPGQQSQVQSNVRKISANIDQLSSIVSEMTDDKIASMEEVKQITESFRSPAKQTNTGNRHGLSSDSIVQARFDIERKDDQIQQSDHSFSSYQNNFISSFDHGEKKEVAKPEVALAESVKKQSKEKGRGL